MGRRKSKPEPLGAVLSKLLEDRGFAGNAHMARLSGKWEEAVGKDVARHARPEMLKGGLLTILVDSSAWMNQLAMLRTTIILQVNSAIGKEQVDDLRFRLGDVQKEAAALRKPPPFIPKKTKPLPEERAKIEESIASIGDAAVRDKARRLLISSISRKK